jgi:hypothetical protein
VRLLEAIRDELVAQGIVRPATVAGALPPMWLSYRGGLPGPGEGSTPGRDADLVTGLRFAGGIPTEPLMGFYERRNVDVLFRGKTATRIEDVDRAIDAVLDDRDGWLMGGLRVEQSLRIRPLGEVYSDELAYFMVTSYTFMVRTASYNAA